MFRFKAILQRGYCSNHSPPLLKQLSARGLVDSVTGTDGELDRLIQAGPIVTYAGVDATASSLHVGHLLPLMNLLHFYLNGHHAIALVGKSTASVGDPSGRTTERDSLESARLNSVFDSLWRQIGGFFDKGREYAVSRGYNAKSIGKRELRTNAEWLDELGLIKFLTTVGPHARVSQMLARESVKGRITSGHGINFAEFTYQLLQSYDFLHLYRTANCRLQIGGNDQFGNITAGIDLISRYKAPSTGIGNPPAYGLTAPLLTTPSGEKFGKSAGNAVWLDSDLTSPFELYQFFIKLPDIVLERYLKMFTLLSLPDISSTISRHAIHPESRIAHHLLAKEVVTLIHGPAKASEAELTTRLLFRTKAHPANPSAAEIISAFEDRIVVVPRQELVGEMLTKVARRVSAVNTRAEAENAIRGGGLYVGVENLKIRDVRATVEEGWLVGGEVLIMRFGKGRFIIVKAV